MSKSSLKFFNDSNPGAFTPSGQGLVAARVKDIILDENHKEYERYNRTESIGVIKYELIGGAKRQDDTFNLPEAYPLNTSVKTFPLLNEIVILVSAPDIGVISESGEKILQRQSNSRVYYSTIVNAWNLVNNNSSPSYYENQLNLGFEIEEQKINPLKPSPGDILIQGRLGQSIRFTGYKHLNNPLVGSSNNGRPLTIIRNGQQKESDKQKFINEDINKDESSIYLASDHLVPLKPATKKHLGIKLPPQEQEYYKGNQVLINSGRLVFNSKDDDILLSSKNIIGLTGEYVSIDGKESLGLDADKIWLGDKAKIETEPVILGDQLELWLLDLLNALQSFADSAATAATVSQDPIPLLNTEGIALKKVLTTLLSKINPGGQEGKKSVLKSKKVFTE